MKTRIALLAILASMLIAFTLIAAADSAPGRVAADSTANVPAAASYAIPWQSINAGGAPAQSTNYQLNSSAGQSVIGYATSTGYKHDIGYWYGVGAEACDCSGWCDLNLQGGINPVDVVLIVNFVYKSNDQRQPIPLCPAGHDPNKSGDWNCDGAVNPIDVVRYVNYVYKGQTNFPPCNPCACTTYPSNCPPWP